jgi:hypothetical protein
MVFDWNTIFTCPDVIGGSQLPDAPLHGSQQTKVPAGEAQAAGQAHAEVGLSQVAGQAQAEAGSSRMATPLMDND